jgi:DeoR/GlpR family transcriptional regulator of sugar metabolism
MAKELGVSALTIRRDLASLENGGRIHRFYGGAALGGGAEEDGSFFRSSLTLNKLAIARFAASLIADGETIFINTSSTAISLIPYITARHVTIITNNVRAMNVKLPPDTNLIFSGGEIRFPKEAMVGDFAVNNLSTVTASKCFLGCNGLTVEEGASTAIMQEASVNRLMLSRVIGQRYILADKSKIGKRFSFPYGSLQEITMLITDTEVPPETIAAFSQYIDVHEVEPLLEAP